MVACKKCKALIIIIIPPPALHSISLLIDLKCEWSLIRHIIVKKHCVTIYGIRTLPPGQLHTRIITPMKLPQDNYPELFAPRHLLLNNSPWTTLPRQLTPMKFPSGQLPPTDNYPWIFSPWTISPRLIDPNEIPPQGNFPLDFCPRPFFLK